ncbi:MAG: Dabb family protein [Verrucomicrobia bacterium]|nr:Dabb family protein [Verrucomicrobiota bacterium]MBI3869969.1 Dabb family protein [Verrucomicrobiota bacterium]
MKLLLLSFVALLSLSTTQAVSAADSAKPVRKGKLAHVVGFKFKATATQAQIDQAVDAFRTLPKKIKQIASFEWGTNVSPEKHDKGFTHCFVLSFKSDKDRDEYLVHPEHKAFGKMLGPIIDDVFVVDYWAAQ